MSKQYTQLLQDMVCQLEQMYGTMLFVPETDPLYIEMRKVANRIYTADLRIAAPVDMELLHSLWEKGWTDKEIAEQLRATPRTIARHRSKFGLANKDCYMLYNSGCCKYFTSRNAVCRYLHASVIPEEELDRTIKSHGYSYQKGVRSHDYELGLYHIRG